jgi:hypothetical protein
VVTRAGVSERVFHEVFESEADCFSAAFEADGGKFVELARAAGLPIRATHRTTLVLRAIARAPYSNNREVAQAAGIVDEGQASKLLARLERRGVIENVGLGAARGEPNAWLLTASGRRAVELIGESFASGAPRPRGQVGGAAETTAAGALTRRASTVGRSLPRGKGVVEK